MTERAHIAGSREYVRRERTRAVELVAIVEDRLGKAGPALACTVSRLGRLERHVFGTGQSAREIAETLREIAQWLDELED